MSGAFGLRVAHITSWRDVQAYASQIRHRRGQKRVRVLGIDGAYVLKKGKVSPVLVAVDMGDGQLLEIGYVDEKDPRAVRRWIDPLAKKLGVSVMVTDDLNTYRLVAEKLDLEHQVCQFHVRRWVGKALKGLRDRLPSEWVWVLEEIKALLADLPVEGSRRLFELWKQVPERRAAPGQPLTPLGELRSLLIRLSEHWPSYRVFDWQKDVPWTNNRTEQAIGRSKVRSRTVRGYKSVTGMLNGLLVAGEWMD
jgi:transposase-like protein